MKKYLTYFLWLACLFFSACEEDNCPPNALSYATFSFVNEKGEKVAYKDSLTVVGCTEFSTLNTSRDTIINRQTNTSILSLPLSYGKQTIFLLHYMNIGKTDTLIIRHDSNPAITNIECGSMMFHRITQVETRASILDSLVIINPVVDNYEKENCKIYFTADRDN